MAPASTTRRDFLRGRTLEHSVDLGIVAVESTLARRHDFEDSLITVSRRAMACAFEVVLPSTTPRAIETGSAALDEVDQLEDQLSVYREASEVSRINALAAATPVPVEARLFDLFETALRLTDETDGAFDIFTGALVKAWGFFRGPKRIPESAELIRVLQRIGSRHVVLDRQQRTIQFRRPGIEINLGAIGKGYALDRAGELLVRTWGCRSALVQGGRSSIYALGAPASDAAGWLLAIAHPRQPDRRVATLRLRDAALATSGTANQYFEVAGQRFGHILDPRTGWPATGQSSVSVIAPTAAVADALSTAFFILGPDRAEQFCATNPDIGAVVIRQIADSDTLDVRLFGRARGLVTNQMNHYE